MTTLNRFREKIHQQEEGNSYKYVITTALWSLRGALPCNSCCVISAPSNFLNRAKRVALYTLNGTTANLIACGHNAEFYNFNLASFICKVTVAGLNIMVSLCFFSPTMPLCPCRGAALRTSVSQIKNL